MDAFTALNTLVLTEPDEADEAGQVAALQALINAGTWGLEGSMGRAMMEAIEAGYCALGPEPAQDYWGNFIPSRGMVEAGTKGSVQFVEEHSPFGIVLED